MNKALLIGRLGGDPDGKTLQSGTSVSSFTLATLESYKDKQGDKVEKTEWHKITAFGKLADICNQYLEKGKQVFIEGKIQTDEWEDKNGNKRHTTKIIAEKMEMLGDKKKEGGYQPNQPHTPDPPDNGEDVPF